MPKTKTEQKELNIKPLAGYVLVEPSALETKTASGLYLPETAQERPAQGVVLAVGSDLVLENGKTVSSPVSLGDTVIYKKWGGDEIKFQGKDLKIVKFDDLMAIIK